MSFLARLAARARFTGAGTSVVMPKGLVARQPLPLLRQPEEEEPQEEAVAPMRAAPLRRQEQPEEQEEEMQRAPAEEEPQEEEAQRSLRRNTRPVRREEAEEQQEDEELAPLRRAENEEEPEEEVAPLRRQGKPEEEEDELQASRVIRRAEEVPLEDGEKPLRQPFQSDLDPANASAHPDLANEEEPPAMQALRRDAVATPPAAPIADTAAPHDTAHQDHATDDRSPLPATLPDFFTRNGGFDAFDTADTHASQPPNGNERPEVIIEQLDVLIHEPAAPPQPAAARADHSRALRARYLRRL